MISKKLKRMIVLGATTCLALPTMAWSSAGAKTSVAGPGQAPAGPQSLVSANCKADAYPVNVGAFGASGSSTYHVTLMYSPSCKVKFARVMQVGIGGDNYEAKLQAQHPLYGYWYDIYNTYDYGYYTSVVFSNPYPSNGPAGLLMRACGKTIFDSNWACTLKG